METTAQQSEEHFIRRFRRTLTVYTAVVLFSYPLLCLIVWRLRVNFGVALREHGSFFPHDPISDTGLYLLVFGLPVAVALWFLYGVGSRPRTLSGKQKAGLTALGIVLTGLSFFISFLLYVAYVFTLERLFP